MYVCSYILSSNIPKSSMIWLSTKFYTLKIKYFYDISVSTLILVRRYVRLEIGTFDEYLGALIFQLCAW